MNHTATGSLADVADAQRAARATINPGWWKILVSAVIAAMLAGFVPVWLGSEHHRFWPGGIVILFFGMLIAFQRLQRRHGTDAGGTRRGSWLSLAITVLVAVGVLIGALFAAALVIQQWLPLGTWSAYAVLAVTYFVLMVAYAFIAERVNWLTPAGQRTKKEARLDDLVAPTPALMLVAVLVLVKAMTVDRLAKILRVPESELSNHITQLASAQYVHTRADAKDAARQWVSLTDAGFDAYTTHLKALRAGSNAAPK